MKLRALLFALLALTASAAGAQRYYSPDFSLGVRAGATLSEMGWSPSVRQKFTPGMTVGLAARYTEERYFGLIAELNLTQRGWAENYETAPQFSYKRQFTYLQLPVMTHIFFGSEKFRGFVNLGPSIGYMLSDKISANFDYANVSSVPGYPGNRHTEQLGMKVAHRFDYGIAGGVGAELRLRRKHSIMLEGRFYYGLANAFPASRGETFGASRSMSIEATLAYLFRLK